MFEKECAKFRKSVENTITDFFGKDFTVSKAVDWTNAFMNSKEYNVDTVSFHDVDSSEREDLAKYRTLNYFINVLIKLDELEKVIRSNR